MLNQVQLIRMVNCTCDLGILRKRNEVVYLTFSKNSPDGQLCRGPCPQKSPPGNTGRNHQNEKKI